MSVDGLGQVRSGGPAHGASAPNFLLRGPVHRHQTASVQFETSRRTIIGSLLRGGMAAGIFAAALGVYVLVNERPPKLGAGVSRGELSAKQQDAAIAAPASVKSDMTEARTEAPSQKSVNGSARQDDPDAPRMVRTERFDGDPSVWVNVRQFVPLPPDQVPVLDIVPPAQPPTAAPAALDSPKDIGASHGKPARAQRHRRPRRRDADDGPRTSAGRQQESAHERLLLDVRPE
jgi:hypothetical protein